MPFQKIPAKKLSQSVVHQIELLILRGILLPGERLPSERDLATKMGVSRPSLRQAISELQERGLLTCKAGAGVFVAEVLGSAFSEGLVKLFARHREAVFDYIDFRRDLETLAAERAARLGSDTDRLVIDTVFNRMQVAHQKSNPSDEARLDADFHMAIAQASNNIIMLHMMRSMYHLLREGVFYNRQIMFAQKTTRAVLLDQHRTINETIQARDADAARVAVHAHLDFIKSALASNIKNEENEVIAKLRYQREISR
jgi:GntR family transcriptional repressor for pyruvate dehydrogenase complex